MKQTIIAAYLALFITFVPAFCLALREERSAQPMEPSPPVETAALPENSPDPRPEPTAQPEPTDQAEPEPTEEPVDTATTPERILVLHAGEVYDVDMQEYLKGVVAAEMPAYFEPEALKAQAVAARTYALYCARTGRHSQAQVCTDYGCCQAWHSMETLQQNWGENFQEHYDAISRAVDETVGQYLSYEGQAVFAAFHASSAGSTEACGAIWNPLPYLISVESPETADTVPNFISQLELSPLDFRDTVLYAHPEADFTGEESGWVSVTEWEDSGRVAAVTLGGVVLSGTELRSLFSLRSTAFSLEYTGESFLFTVSGHGHGVGMSQYGANLMAAQGSDHTQILAHYYPGTSLIY